MPETSRPWSSILEGEAARLACSVLDILSSCEYLSGVILTEMPLSLFMRWIKPYFSRSTKCFDADCWDLPTFLPRDEVVTGTKLCSAPASHKWQYSVRYR